ncbi:MAG: porin, partial [Hyphomicrobiales bacterium]|nr:porin [Hyphomicrobiales bacterium]
MKLKSLLYGTAAVLVSTGATNVALAADLPVAAEPIDYVRVCDAFGKGYYYIPGTDTCLRVNGRVRIRAFIRDNDDSDDDTDHYTTYARAYINMDARTQTDLGLLRSYFSFRHTFGDNGVSTSNYDQSYTVGGTRNVLDEAFISLSNDMGQLIVGKTSSFFDFFGGYTYTGNGGYDQTDDANLFAYTFNIGNGVSTTLSLEDPYASGRKNGPAGDV